MAKRAVPQAESARRADYRDAEVGSRIRSRRRELGVSQTTLAKQIGITFQQVQKYEKGVNKIGAGRLAKISDALEVPISFFFGTSNMAERVADSVFDLAQDVGMKRLLKAFNRIEIRATRKLLVDMAENLARNNGA